MRFDQVDRRADRREHDRARGPIPGPEVEAVRRRVTDEEVHDGAVPVRPAGPGAALPEAVRTKMERSFATDFSGVRVHVGAEARNIGAVAFARGSDLHFAPGSYRPDTVPGQTVIGHELAHTVQQAEGRVRRTIQAKGVGINDSDALEREADRMGARAARGLPARAARDDARSAPVADSEVVQRLIHVHEVNELFGELRNRKFTKRAEQHDAVRSWLSDRLTVELTAMLGADYRDGKYVGASDLIPWLVEELHRTVGESKALNGEDVETLRQDLNGQLLEIERANAPKQYLPSLAMGELKIGNEFTFTNATLRQLVDTHGPKIEAAEDKKKAKEAYDKANTEAVEAIIAEWEQYMRAFASTREPAKPAEGKGGGAKPGEGSKAPVEKKVGIISERGRTHKGQKVRFLFPSLGWHFDVTVDPGCVEVITPPTEASKLERGEIADLIDTYIFGVAKSIGLHADPMFGGGHINIDRTQAFESGGRNLGAFLRGYLDDAAFWKGRDADKQNAPFPDELDGPERLKKALGILDKYDPLYKAPLADVTAINGRLATELINNVFNTNIAGEAARDSPHYQAVNLEHFAEKEVAERRVEVRRVPAQVDRATLLNELDRLFALIAGTALPSADRFAGKAAPEATWTASKGSSKKSSAKEGASSGPSARPTLLGANELAPAQGPVLAANHLVHVPILGDGNCFFNAVIRTAGLNTTVAALRKELADAVQAALDQGTLAGQFPFIEDEEVTTIIADLRADGSYANLAGDVAPMILTIVRPALRLRIIQGSGMVNDVGNGGTDVWLVRTSHSVDHYLATRPRA